MGDSIRKPSFARRPKQHMSFWHPLRLRQVTIMMLLTAISAYVLSNVNVAWPPVTWNGLEVHVRDAQIGAAMSGAFFGALQARQCGERSVIAPPVSCRSSVETVGRALGLLAAANVVAYAVGMLPSIMVTGSSAVGGASDALPLLAVVCNIAWWPAVGFFIGLISQHPLSPVLAICVANALIGIPIVLSNSIAGFSMLSIAPVWQLGFPFVGERSHPGTAWTRMVLFAMLGFSLCMACISVHRGTVMPRNRGDVRWFVWFVPPTVLGIIMVMMQPQLVAMDWTMRAICESAGRVTVCVAAPYSRALKPALVIGRKAYALFP